MYLYCCCGQDFGYCWVATAEEKLLHTSELPLKVNKPIAKNLTAYSLGL